MATLPRIPIKRSVRSPHMFISHFYAGYDLCPTLYSEDILSTFTFRFGDFNYTLPQPIKSKNPIWNLKISIPISLDDNLEFASSILISFTNLIDNNPIGSITI